ncbi:hypothetical protein POM88_002472 [Heracleum sosnowskyi]|uniref:Protein kinase domain-containing protein n=1 Tax=Heracleum sosnowskyi TaxID=360622 RepID=A0AAD8JI12_9APIA|nr:hypothetical protein POM88_002472 [Heracleum sosnowskyi]
MEEGDGTNNSWRLFTSEKLIGAYRRKDRRREMNKENNTHTSDNGSSSHLSPYTRIGSSRICSSNVTTPLSGQTFDRTALSNITNRKTSKKLEENHILRPSQSPDPASGCPYSNVTTIGSSMPLKRKQFKGKSKVNISGKGCTLFEDNSNMSEEEINSSDVHEIVKRKTIATKSKFKACSSTRKLTEQDFNVNEVGNDDLYDDQIENSRIKDLTDSDVDFDSDVEGSDDFTSDDEEMDIDSDNEYECYTNGNGAQRGKVKSKYQILEEYASLGGPSAKCLKCNARMWKDEPIVINNKGDAKKGATDLESIVTNLNLDTGLGVFDAFFASLSMILIGEALIIQIVMVNLLIKDVCFDLGPDMEPPSWNARMRIAYGAAKGLDYLHNDVKPQAGKQSAICFAGRKEETYSLRNDSGVTVGCGWQAFVAYVNVGCYYAVGILLGVLLGVYFDMGAKGIWSRMIGGTTMQTLILIWVTYHTISCSVFKN